MDHDPRYLSPAKPQVVSLKEGLAVERYEGRGEHASFQSLSHILVFTPQAHLSLSIISLRCKPMCDKLEGNRARRLASVNNPLNQYLTRKLEKDRPSVSSPD